GRPQLRSPTAPPTRNRSRHWYRDFGLIPSSAASTLGRSPASNRRSAASLNSRLNLRASFRAISSPFSKENCPSFHCLIPGVHSSLEVSDEGAIIDAAGQVCDSLFAVGPITKGVFWETTAVPDIRVQCERLAAHMLATIAAPKDRVATVAR